ncbi:carbohydrate ABC transporter permease [Pelatocladus sp. BLCC-F211]|uniref:carbohydrate ABC transporter permease n=1 Tax=Pelatocladus sp. BLCC-F211 TaxID=3342752 RepID=UPI0035B78673
MPKIYSKSSQSWLDNDSVAAWFFLTPALILLGIFILWPIAYLFYLSFTTGIFSSGGTHWVGLKNYWRLLSDSDFWQVIFNTLYFTLATVIPSLVIPLGIALLLNQALPLGGFIRSAYFLPSMISLVAGGLGFRWLFQNDGTVNALLDIIGIKPIPWLSSTVWAMPVLIILSIWKQLGFNMVVFLAGLQTIPQSRYEAAELDGANSWQKFWYITLPGLQSTLIFAIVTTMIFTLRSFEQVYVMTGGGPLNSTNLMVYYIYQEAFAQFDFGYAAAAATVLFAVTLLLVYLQLQTWNEES